MSFWNRLVGDGTETTKAIQHEDEGERVPLLGKLQLVQGDILVVTVPDSANMDYVGEYIHSAGNQLEKELGWRPLMLAMPEGWAIGAFSPKYVADFMHKVLAAIEPDNGYA